MKAPLPSAIRCPHCRQKIRVRGVVPFLAGYLLLVVALTTWLIVERRRNVISSGVVIVAAIIALGFFEFVMSVIVLRRARFEKPGP